MPIAWNPLSYRYTKAYSISGFEFFHSNFPLFTRICYLFQWKSEEKTKIISFPPSTFAPHLVFMFLCCVMNVVSSIVLYTAFFVVTINCNILLLWIWLAKATKHHNKWNWKRGTQKGRVCRVQSNRLIHYSNISTLNVKHMKRPFNFISYSQPVKMKEILHFIQSLTFFYGDAWNTVFHLRFRCRMEQLRLMLANVLL